MKASGNTGEHDSKVAKLLIVIFILLVAIAGVAYWGWHRSNTSNSNSSSNSSANASPYSQNNSGSSPTTIASSANMCNSLALSKGSSDSLGDATEWHAVITNNGTQDCTLTGYPGAYVKDSGSVVIGATDNPLYPLDAVKLAARGGKAHVLVGVGGTRNLSGKTVCSDQTSTQLQLYLPGVVSPVQAMFGEQVCNVFTVSAVQPGA